MSGYSSEELVNRNPIETFVYLEDQEIVLNHYLRRLKGDITPHKYDFRLVCKDGSLKWIELKTTMILWEGRPAGLAVATDVSDAKRLQEALRSSEARFRNLFETSNDAILLSDRKTFLECNPKAVEIFGCQDQKDIVGHSIAEFIPEKQPNGSDSAVVGQQYMKAAFDNVPQTFYFRHRRKNGSEFDAEVTFSLLTIDNNPYLQGRVRDITSQKLAEEALRESEAKYRLLAENTRDVIWQLNLDLIFTYVNPAILEMTGFTTSEWIGSRLADHCDELNFARMSRVVSDEISRGTEASGFTIEAVLITKNNRPFTAEIVGKILLDEKGRPVALQGVTRDISDRKRDEEARIEFQKSVIHAQKLESLSVMAGGIAHDFNNQLMAVLGNLELVLDDLPPESQARKLVANAFSAAERSAQLSGQMLTYTGSHLYKPVDIDLSSLVTKSLALFKLQVSEHVNLMVNTFDGIPSFKGDTAQIRRLITNIILNASEAISDKPGEVHLSTGMMDCDEAYLSNSLLAEKPATGRFVYVEVTDSGCGMNTETIQKMFDPFFTTKFAGRGLGLAEVIGTVKGHRGAIMVSSRVGVGTTVRVLFPAPLVDISPSIDAIRPPSPADAKTYSSSDKKNVLVVDDEKQVLEVVSAWLRHLGYDVIEASDGEQAVNVVKKRFNEIDLVILDFVMPKMNGVEAFEEMLKIRGDMKVILSSGYAEDDVMGNFGDQRPACVLHKPYKMAKLRKEVERLLGPVGVFDR